MLLFSLDQTNLFRRAPARAIARTFAVLLISLRATAALATIT
jgi:hypothetical protein